MTVFAVPAHLLEMRISTYQDPWDGRRETIEVPYLIKEVELWLSSRLASTHISGGYMPTLEIRDEDIAVEFKLTWL